MQKPQAERIGGERLVLPIGQQQLARVHGQKTVFALRLKGARGEVAEEDRLAGAVLKRAARRIFHADKARGQDGKAVLRARDLIFRARARGQVSQRKRPLSQGFALSFIYFLHFLKM